MSSILSVPPTLSPFDQNNNPSSVWVEWVLSLYSYSRKYRGADTTANRPVNALEIGDWYYDLTLGYPIWVHQITPSIIWHNGAGASV